MYEGEDERKKGEGRNGEEEILKRRMGQEMSRREEKKVGKREWRKISYLQNPLYKNYSLSHLADI